MGQSEALPTIRVESNPLHLLCLILFVILVPYAYTDFSGQVVGIVDGDTIEVLNGHQAERIRLSGIDCTENGQAYSKKAKQSASALVFGKKEESKGSGVSVDSERENYSGHLFDVDHSRQILQIRVACDDLSLLVFGGCIHNRIGHR